jgi:hypothetical protein
MAEPVQESGGQPDNRHQQRGAQQGAQGLKGSTQLIPPA